MDDSELFELTFDEKSTTPNTTEQGSRESLEVTLLKGYLFKSSGREKGKPKRFQKRWFTLSVSGITYYKSNKGTKPLKKKIELHLILSIGTADSDTKRDHSFQVVTQERTYYLIAESYQEQQEWLRAVQKLLISSSGSSIDHGSEDLCSISSSPSEDYCSLKEETTDALGAVYKLGGKRRDLTSSIVSGYWQKRYLVLEEEFLSYYKKLNDPKATGKILLAEITSVLPNADSLTQKEFSFRISTEHRNYYFYARSENQRALCVERIQNCISPDNFVTSEITSVQVSLRDDHERVISNRLSNYGEDMFTDSDFEVETSYLKEGYLWKTPGYKKKPGGWQKRWFVMDGNMFSYFKHPKDTKEAGTVDLRNVSRIDPLVEKGSPGYRFNVYTEARVYYLYAESEIMRDAWINSLRSTVKLHSQLSESF